MTALELMEIHYALNHIEARLMKMERATSCASAIKHIRKELEEEIKNKVITEYYEDRTRQHEKGN